MTANEITKPGVHFITEPIKVKSGERIFGNGARLVGGVRVAVTRVHEDGLCECDLAGQGITLSGFRSRGVYREKHPSHSELFINSRPANISRYPKIGSNLIISDVGDPTADPRWNHRCGRLEGGFFYEDERPKSWAESKNIWVHGYWSADWASTREHIDIIDKDRGFIKCSPPYGADQYKVGQRFFFFNIREEVTEPGDYFLDFDRNTLYFRPFEDTDIESAELILSSCDRPVFDIEDAEDVVIENFVIEDFRGNGISINNSKDITIRNCEIKNIGSNAVIVKGSVNVFIRGCSIHHIGDSGVKFRCGDRKTLTPGNCGVEDCRLHHISSWDHCYEPPIVLQGVGNTARRNIIHDCPHSALIYQGNDMIITDNEIYRVILDTGDAGAIYTGRNYTFRGNVISRNFFHHIGRYSQTGFCMAVYEDDCISGTRIEDNVFAGLTMAVLIGGGVDFEINRNIFFRCGIGVSIDGRGQFETPVWRNMVGSTLRENFYDVNADKEPYISRYPELKKIDRLYKAEAVPHIPPSVHAAENLFLADEPFRVSLGSLGGDVVIDESNIKVDADDLRAYLTPRQISVMLDEKD